MLLFSLGVLPFTLQSKFGGQAWKPPIRKLLPLSVQQLSHNAPKSTPAAISLVSTPLPFSHYWALPSLTWVVGFKQASTPTSVTTKATKAYTHTHTSTYCERQRGELNGTRWGQTGWHGSARHGISVMFVDRCYWDYQCLIILVLNTLEQHDVLLCYCSWLNIKHDTNVQRVAQGMVEEEEASRDQCDKSCQCTAQVLEELCWARSKGLSVKWYSWKINCVQLLRVC